MRKQRTCRKLASIFVERPKVETPKIILQAWANNRTFTAWYCKSDAPTQKFRKTMSQATFLGKPEISTIDLQGSFQLHKETPHIALRIPLLTTTRFHCKDQGCRSRAQSSSHKTTEHIGASLFHDG